MIMAKEVVKDSLDKTAQSYLKDTASFLGGSYDEYNKRVKSIDEYVSSIKKSRSKLLNDMSFLYKYGIVSESAYNAVKSIEV